MLRLLERSVATVGQRLILVPPPHVVVPPTFRNAIVDPALREALVRQVQRLRGAIYLSDGAIRRADLSFDGRHRTNEDSRSWHLLVLNRENQISSCAWYLEHAQAPSFDHLRVRRCPLNHFSEWGERLMAAVHHELTRAQRAGLKYAEVGGWAVAPENRCTSEGLLLALAAYSLGRMLGGCLGITTATVRHSSSRILRRLGGAPLEADGVEIPAYFDPNYDCTMELLRFDSRRPNPKYSSLVDRLRDKLAQVPVIATAIALDPGDHPYDLDEECPLQPAMAV
jgi:hypothetical protein